MQVYPITIEPLEGFKVLVEVPNEVSTDLGVVFYCTIGKYGIQLYTEIEWEVYCAKINELPYEKMKMYKPIFAYAERVSMQGNTFVLSRGLCERGNVVEGVVFCVLNSGERYICEFEAVESFIKNQDAI
jgi:hypothetical protein